MGGLGSALMNCATLPALCDRKITEGAGGKNAKCHMHYNSQLCNSHFMAESDPDGWDTISMCKWCGTCGDGISVMVGNTNIEDGKCQADANDDGCYISAWEVKSLCPQILETKAKVLAADKDNNAILNVAEVGNFLRAEGLQATETELQLIVSAMDEDGDKGLNFNEFLWMMISEMKNFKEKPDPDTDEASMWAVMTCVADQEVFCPVSGQLCKGDTCCPGVKETGGLSFPCPSAYGTWCGCGNRTKLQDCTTPLVTASSACQGTCATMCTGMADELKGWPAACAAHGKLAGAMCAGCPACCSMPGSSR